MGTPIAGTYPPPLASGDRDVKAFAFSPWPLRSRHFPNEVRQTFEGWPSATFRTRTKEAMERLGFSVAAESAIPLFHAKAPREGHAPKPLVGVWVGERNLRLDLTLRKRADLRMAGLAVLAVALVVVTLAVSPLRPYLVLAALAGGMMFAGVISAYTGRGAFDSDIVYVVAETSPNLAPGTTLTPDDPLTLEVRSGSARVTTANWAAKHSSGRSLKKVNPADLGLTGTPSELLKLIRG
ncbi:MAG: hypothetical protein L3K18_03880 [Thermoplasmata archaeon]|nr:hypothetical protein [Thermoplasmata archaeon]MCI4356269.1 hypothetical protein [Thermoplasmata archaeon]